MPNTSLTKVTEWRRKHWFALRRTKHFLEMLLSSATKWISGDVLYASLPIIVLTLLDSFLSGAHSPLDHFNEWSFGAIVLFGVSLRQTVHLNTTLKTATPPERLGFRMQFLILCVVSSVSLLVLGYIGKCLGTEDSKPVVSPINIWQVGLFGLGAVYLLYISLQEGMFSAVEDKMPVKQTPEIFRGICFSGYVPQRRLWSTCGSPPFG